MKKRNSNHAIALIVLVTLSLFITACASDTLAAADKMDKQPVVYASGGQFSGDDVYDPAANVALWLSDRGAGTSFSGDDAYDPAVSLFPTHNLFGAGTSYSGDDAYDPAVSLSLEHVLPTSKGSFSGDDAYDPAAGGLAR